jgi:hypothetical protein
VQFEKMMIDQIVAQKDSLFGDCIEETLNVLFRFYDRSLFEQGLAKSVNRALKDNHTFGYSLESKPEELAKMIVEYKRREYKQTILTDDFKKIAKLVAQASPDCGKNPDNYFRAALLLIHDVLISKE